MGTLEGYVEGMINLSGGGGGGTSDYEELTNKPSINNVTLSGNKTTSDLNLSYNDLLNKPYINNMPSSTRADIGDVLTHTSDGDEWSAPEKELPTISAASEGKLLIVSNGVPVWGSAYTKDLLYNGSIYGTGDYALSSDISNYDEILIVAYMGDVYQSMFVNKKVQVSDITTFNSTGDNSHRNLQILGAYNGMQVYAYLNVWFKDISTFHVMQTGSVGGASVSDSGFAIRKIYGIKY